MGKFFTLSLFKKREIHLFLNDDDDDDNDYVICIYTPHTPATNH